MNDGQCGSGVAPRSTTITAQLRMVRRSRSSNFSHHFAAVPRHGLDGYVGKNDACMFSDDFSACGNRVTAIRCETGSP